MSNFPSELDNDSNIPAINSNITEIGDITINALRDAVFNIEATLGINPQGSVNSVANRLNVSLNPDGSINSSALTSLGLVTLPITNSQIAPAAGIPESKLTLDFSTINLNNKINFLSDQVANANNFISVTGSKLQPHLDGEIYRHTLDQIDVASTSSLFLKNKFGLLRDNSNSYTLINDINNELITHELADGYFGAGQSVLTAHGMTLPFGFAHVASSVFINTSRFNTIPQTINDLQQFSDYIDGVNLLLLGSRIQTLYQNGIPRSSRSAGIINTNFGQPIVPITNGTAYLLFGDSSSPVDNIDHGDDLVEFLPDSSLITNNSFDGMFALVNAGDTVVINYGSFSVSALIKEKKYSVDLSGNKRYVVRIDSKNLAAQSVSLSVNRSLVNTNKYGVLALGQANSPLTGVLPSLIAGNPGSAEVLGLGFNPNSIDSTHYNLYITAYPNGNPTNGIFNLPAIDISGNKGLTPGTYTLDSVVLATNNAFRSPGFNNRFLAYSYQGEFGIMATDGINNFSFSVINGTVDQTTGLYNQTVSNLLFPNNVIGVPGFDNVDPLGFSFNGSGISSPQYQGSSFGSSLASQNPTRLFVPLTRNFYYVNGNENANFAQSPQTTLDGYGNGFWESTIIQKNIIPGVRVEVVYQVNLDLSSTNLQVGKTLTAIGGTTTDSGRFVISNIVFNNCCGTANPTTNITVYDAIQSATGVTPFASSPIGTPVNLYFSPDSIGFNIENASDDTTVSPFKRHMEIYVDQNGNTFSHERARMSANVAGTTLIVNTINLFGDAPLTNNLNLVKVSPKLRGFVSGTVTKINLQITSYNIKTGIFQGFLCSFDGSTISNQGATVVGKKGNVVRFYDQTNIDYIDVAFDLNANIPAIVFNQSIDIQLFPTLSLDDEVLLIGTTQVNDQNFSTSYLRDARQFGNTSEKQFSTSALDFIAAPTKLLQENGVIRGFDLISATSGNDTSASGVVVLNGGVAIVNGKIIQLNNEQVEIPPLIEVLYPSFSTQETTITWFVCVNDKAELVLVASTDFDPSNTIYSVAGLDETRIFYVSNPNNSITNNYPIRGTYFSDLVLSQTDLVPVAIINSTSTGGSPFDFTTINSSSDCRRFIGNGNGGLVNPLVFGTNSNFQSYPSLISWLTQLNTLNSAVNLRNQIGSNVIIKESFSLLASITFPNFLNRVVFKGDGGNLTSIIFNFGNNTTLKQLTLAPSSSLTVGNNGSINGCSITSGSITLGTNSTITNSSITTSSNITLGANSVIDNSSIISNGILILGTGAIARNNTITRSSTSGSNMLNLLGTANIFENVFVRGANTISHYIDNTTSNTNVVVINNSFDSTTVDGSVENLTLNMVPGTTYKENINQIGYATAFLLDMNRTILTGDDIAPQVGSGIIAQLTAATTSGGTSSVLIYGSLNKYLPTEVKLLNAVIGVNGLTPSSNYDTTGATEFVFEISTDFPSIFNPSSPAGSLADNISFSTPISAAVSSNNFTLTSGNVAAFIAATQYLSANLSPLNSNYDLYTNLEFNILVTIKAASSHVAQVVFSPLIIKYKW